MKIIFMGSPDFAVPALNELVQQNFNIIKIYTQPPRPAGRGKKIVPTQINHLANHLGLSVHCPEKLRSDEEYEFFKSLSPDLVVVVAYGLIIPKRFLEVPKYGFINIHPSDLPKYRGAAPIQRTILGGEVNTALCIMQMDAGLDTGDVLAREFIDITDKPSFKELHDKLALIGAKELIKVIKQIDCIKPVKQSDELASYAAKISKEEGRIDSSDDLDLIDRKIRALNPWPGTYIELDKQVIKIISANFEKYIHQDAPGSIIIKDDILKIATKDGYLLPTVVQREGRNKILVSDFIRGYEFGSSSNHI
jgi:methionyl-tRNA formyltransferase